MKVSAQKTHAQAHHVANEHEKKADGVEFEKALQHAGTAPKQKKSDRAVPPLPASGHPPLKGEGIHLAAHLPSAAKQYVPLLAHVGSHVDVAAKSEKDKPKAEKPVELPIEQAVRLELQPPTPAPAHAPSPAAATATPLSAPATPVRAESEVHAVLAPLPPLPIEPALAQQDSLRVMLMPHSAKVSVETAEAGRLSMRVDVKDGVAHVRASGEAAPLVDQRHAELRVALAQEGLALGNFELGQQQHSPDEPDRPSDASGFRRAQPSAKPATADAVSLDGRLHIHA